MIRGCPQFIRPFDCCDHPLERLRSESAPQCQEGRQVGAVNHAIIIEVIWRAAGDWPPHGEENSQVATTDGAVAIKVSNERSSGDNGGNHGVELNVIGR